MATREQRSGRVQTVRGLIAPGALGPTLMHEHVLIDLNPPVRRGPTPGRTIRPEDFFDLRWGAVQDTFAFRLDDPALATTELALLRAEGGGAVVDLTNGGLCPDPQALAAISAASGVHIVMGSGHYTNDYQDPANAGRSAEDFAREMIGQIEDGAWGTPVCAGILGEIGCQSPWTDQEKRVLQGALLAQAETGATINVHPGRDPDQPAEVAAFVRAAGADPARVVLSHIDRTIFDTDRLLRLADSGCVLEFDLFGWVEGNYFPNPAVDLPNDPERLKLLRLLIGHGHLERLTISHDLCMRTRLRRYGGHGYGHILRNVVPLMRRRDFDETEIDALLVGNPARLLTFL